MTAKGKTYAVEVTQNSRIGPNSVHTIRGVTDWSIGRDRVLILHDETGALVFCLTEYGTVTVTEENT